MKWSRGQCLCVGSALISLCLSGAPAAQPAEEEARGVSAAFGNTVLSVYPDGRTQVVWLSPDGTWSGITREKWRVRGRWRTKGDKVCLRQTNPMTIPVKYCAPVPGDATIGTTWNSKDLTGTPIEIRILEGRTFDIAK